MRNRAIRVRVEPRSGNLFHGHKLLFISYTSEVSKFDAQAVTRELVSHATGLNLVEMLDSPTLPETAVWPNRIVLALLGMLVGVLIGITWAVVRRWRAPAPAY
jgi:uncharacterized protein involved in exopolysaccharide biosynthesis